MVLQQQLTERAAQTRSCYERLLQKDPTRQGRVLVKVRMSGAGEFEQATITEDDFSLPEFSECILARFREPTGTSIDANCVEVNVPFRFMPKKSPPLEGTEPKQASPADSTPAENRAQGQAAPDPSAQSR
jgi:hypothetical protein